MGKKLYHYGNETNGSIFYISNKRKKCVFVSCQIQQKIYLNSKSSCISIFVTHFSETLR